MKGLTLSLALAAALADGAYSQPVSSVKLLEPIAADAMSGTSVALIDAAGCRYAARIGHGDAAGVQSGTLVQPDTAWYIVVTGPRCAKPALLRGTVIPLPHSPSAEQSRGLRGYRPGTTLALTQN